ncbi:NAD(P)/FAD-dependent oxidoreductase [Mesorhizobium sp. CCNWLW179-1]|uniref:flavin-containing monooxygenase n=1 Tax=unclassified Mesorhizobium TaxID=325217 RepID=UPI00301490AB
MSKSNGSQPNAHARLTSTVDVLVIGAGLAGIYSVHKIRDDLGLSVQGIEAFEDVGGVWYTNRYPGARVDSLSQVYCYTFNDDLINNWSYSEKYPTQQEILRYINFAADKLDVRRSIKFGTRVTSLVWHEKEKQWEARTDRGDVVLAQFVISAAGGLSAANKPDFKDFDNYQGEVYFTAHWPHHEVDLTGKTIGVIGTGSSGIQVIPELAKVAKSVTVFQRTPHFATPAKNKPHSPEEQKLHREQAHELHGRLKWSFGGNPLTPLEISVHEATPEEREKVFDRLYNAGDFSFWLANYNDILTDASANDIVAEYLRERIRSIVKDPATAEKLVPKSYPYGTKRQPLETNYYQAFNLDHVSLVDINEDPIVGMTVDGIELLSGVRKFDVLVFATGFDALTGALTRIHIVGVDGEELAQKWKDGPSNYLGISVAGFPNLFTITGPGSPGVLANVPMAIEQHVELAADIIAYAKEHDISAMEAEVPAQEAWMAHLKELADKTLFPVAASWYMGANVPGKPRVFMPYVDGMASYRRACNEVVAKGYEGFEQRK